MTLHFHPLPPVEPLDCASPPSAAALHLLRMPPGTLLRLPPGWLSAWIALRGRTRLHSLRGRWWLERNELLVAQEGALDAECAPDACALVLVGPRAAWSALAGSADGTGELLVGQWPCPRPVRRRFVRLARALRDGGHADVDGLAAALADALRAQQTGLRALAARCNGRTSQRRHATLQRLLRVRQLIERSEQPLDLAGLARDANYSPWHLMRMYRDVFGETPSAHLARLRLARAWSLVRGTPLPVCEIAGRLGFESQSAFCRAFKTAYGQTTTEARNGDGMRPEMQARAAIAKRPAGKPGFSLRPPHARPRKRNAPAPLNALR